MRYAPGSAFPAHVHSGGEEIPVLESVFQDEHGDYPAGSYFRKPPGNSHSPAAAEGCTIFVRLWQYREDDLALVVRQPGEGEAAPLLEGASAARVLFEDNAERVSLEDWRPGAAVIVANDRGLEFVLVLGSLALNGDDVTAPSWGRLPAGEALAAVVGLEGAQVWLKEAPLQHPDVLPMPSDL